MEYRRKQALLFRENPKIRAARLHRPRGGRALPPDAGWKSEPIALTPALKCLLQATDEPRDVVTAARLQ